MSRAKTHSALLLTPSEILLLQAALLDGEAALAAWRKWQAVTSIATADASSVFIFPALYRNLRKLAPKDPALIKLRGVHRHTWARNELAMEGVRRATAALSAAGVRALLLKGVPLLETVYRDRGARMMVDTDVAVRRDDFSVADRVLCELGFCAAPASPRVPLPPFVHAVMYRHPRWLELDLHVQPLGICCAESALTGLWQRAQPLAGMGAPAPDITDLFFLTLVSGRKPDVNGRIRWIVDALTMLRSQRIGWESLLGVAAAFQVRPTVLAQLRLLVETFAAPVPQAVLAQLACTPASRIELQRDRVLCGIDSTRRPLWALLPQRWSQYRFSCDATNRSPSVLEFARCCADYLAWQFNLDGIWQVPGLLYRDAVKGQFRAAPESRTASPVP